MPREFLYNVPFQRLIKLSRSASRKAYRGVWLSSLMLVAIYIGCLVALVVYGDALIGPLEAVGVPYAPEMAFAGVVALFLLGFWLLRRLGRSQMKERADYDQTIRFTEDDGGLRFATDEVEHYVKWSGISQILVEPDGVAVSHASLFFFIPASAFTSDADRVAFVREIYGRLNDKARARSERHVRALIEPGPQQS